MDRQVNTLYTRCKCQTELRILGVLGQYTPWNDPRRWEVERAPLGLSFSGRPRGGASTD